MKIIYKGKAERIVSLGEIQPGEVFDFVDLHETLHVGPRVKLRIGSGYVALGYHGKVPVMNPKNGDVAFLGRDRKVMRLDVALVVGED